MGGGDGNQNPSQKWSWGSQVSVTAELSLASPWGGAGQGATKKCSYYAQLLQPTPAQDLAPILQCAALGKVGAVVFSVEMLRRDGGRLLGPSVYWA